MVDGNYARDGPTMRSTLIANTRVPLYQVFGDMTGTKILDLHAGSQFFAVGNLVNCVPVCLRIFW